MNGITLYSISQRKKGTFISGFVCFHLLKLCQFIRVRNTRYQVRLTEWVYSVAVFLMKKKLFFEFSFFPRRFRIRNKLKITFVKRKTKRK